MKLQTVTTLLFLVVLCNAQDEFEKQLPCNSAFRCSYDVDTTWATDGKKCYVFRNPCHLAKENCKRQNQYDYVLKGTSREKCQVLCDPRCPKTKQSICGYYNDNFRQFTNKCSMNYYICRTGETYLYYYEGSCEDPLYYAN